MKLTRVFFRLIDWQWQFDFFEQGSLCQFLMSLDQQFARVRARQRRDGHELDF